MRPSTLALLFLSLLAPAALLPAAARADDLAERRNAVVRAVERARPGVVSIRTNEIVRVPRYYDWFFDDGSTVPQERESSLGSGAIFHPAGFVITNAHVIARASRIFVTVAPDTGKEFEREARLVSVDLDNDLAILQLLSPNGQPETYPYLPLGRSDDLMIGETVIAIGNPFRLGITVTTGVVSALHRSIRPAKGSGDTEFRDFIQVDAAINPGNSGGPIVDVTGRWVGVNTAILNRAMGAEGIGFAIPADRVRDMIGRAFKRRLVTGEWTGYDLESGPQGVPVVRQVYDFGPARGAGLRRGDRILGLDGRATPTLYDYRLAESEAPRGAFLRLRIGRDGGEQEVRVALQAVPVADLARARFGFAARDVRAEDQSTLGVPAQGGVVITSVVPGGPSERVRLQPGDVLTALGNLRVRNLDDLVSVLEMVRPGDNVTLRVQRLGRDAAGEGVVRDLAGTMQAD